MLEIKKIIKTDDPGFQGVFIIPDNNVGFLLNYAINSLLRKGTIQVLEMEEEDMHESDIDESEKTALAVMSTQDMFPA